MGSQVFGTGSDNISGFSWDYGTVGVSNESSGIWVSSISVSVSSVVSSVPCSVSSIWVTSIGTSISSIWESTLSGEVSSGSCGNFWGQCWGYGTIGVGDEVGCAGSSDTCEENQEFHVCS